jgi:hypothetical protein
MNKSGSENKNYASCTITPGIEYPVAQNGTDKGVSFNLVPISFSRYLLNLPTLRRST